MANHPALFHIGYHKTGTTWLQRRLFETTHGYAPLASHEGVYTHITRPHRLVFDPAAAREALLSGAEKAAPLVPVISSEILSGHPFWGGRESFDFAHRIQAIAPEARILITIRAQIPAIASVYMQYIRRRGTMSASRFFDGSQVLGFDGFDPVHFEYHHLVALYQRLFGADRVMVLTQERLARDPKGAVAALARFSGANPDLPIPSTARENASEAESAVFALRRINHFLRDGANPAPIVNLGPISDVTYRSTGRLFQALKTRGILAGKPVTVEAKRRFAGRFAASNQALMDMCEGLELPGYEI